MTDWKTEIMARVSKNEATHDDLKRLYCATTGDYVLDYNLFMYERFGIASAFNTFPLGSSFDFSAKYSQTILRGMDEAIRQVYLDLLDTLDASSIAGEVVEFGVAAGGWIGQIIGHMEKTGKVRKITGFDSFEGLPDRDPAHDHDHWQTGQFANSLEIVSDNLRLNERPFLQLVKGWFATTLSQPIAQSITEIAFAKIDCDLYQPAVECLEYLRGRLADGAVLMFDDWPYNSNIGETKAFMEWEPTVPQYRFELVGFINWRIFMRVWHRRT